MLSLGSKLLKTLSIGCFWSLNKNYFSNYTRKRRQLHKEERSRLINTFYSDPSLHFFAWVIMGAVLFAGGEGLPEEILAGRFISARGLLEGQDLLPFGHLPGFPSYKGHCPVLGGPLTPPRKESQQAVLLYFCHFLHMLLKRSRGQRKDKSTTCFSQH